MRLDGTTDTYPVGLFSDWRRRRLRAGVRYLRHQAGERNWRAVRNYFNGYLAEHRHGGHNAGRGWTKAAAQRRVARICAASRPADTDAEGVSTDG